MILLLSGFSTLLGLLALGTSIFSGTFLLIEEGQLGG